MMEQYLHESKKLFEIEPIKLNNTFPLEERLIEFNDEFTEIDVSQRYNKDTKTYSVFGTIVYSARIFDPDLKLEAINAFFIENQETLNKYVAWILSKEGIFVNPSEKGLYLANGRSISTNGLWFMHHTNNYNFSEEPEFRNLMKEETELVSKSFAVIYGLIHYVIDNNPRKTEFKKFSEDQSSLNFTESKLVNKYINKEVTEKMNSYFFSAVGKTESAERIVQNSYVKDAMVEKDTKSIN